MNSVIWTTLEGLVLLCPRFQVPDLVLQICAHDFHHGGGARMSVLNKKKRISPCLVSRDKT